MLAGQDSFEGELNASVSLDEPFMTLIGLEWKGYFLMYHTVSSCVIFAILNTQINLRVYLWYREIRTWISREEF